MKKINIFLFLTLAMVGFSAVAMDEINTKNEMLRRQIDQAVKEGVDLYGLVGLNPSATDEEIKKAKRETLLKNHPDKGGDAETFKKLNNAFEILTGPRILYHVKLRQAQKGREEELHKEDEEESREQQEEASTKQAAESAAYDAEMKRRAELRRAEERQQREAEKAAREAQIRAYRQELERMSIGELAEKFNFFELLGISYKQCENFSLLRACYFTKKSSATDELLKEQVELAHNILRYESGRKAYNAALKKRLAREERAAEEAARPKKQKSSFLGSFSRFLSDNF
jgi:curved DNA-binding protein CbpA